MASAAQAQNVGARLSAPDTRWAEVEAFEAQSLPKSAWAVVDKIHAEALKKGNSPELIKAMIYRLKYQSAIDHTEVADKLAEVKTFADADKNKVEQAVLYSLLAEFQLPVTSYQLPSVIAGMTRNPQSPPVIAGLTRNPLSNNEMWLKSVLPARELQAAPAAAYQGLLTDTAMFLTMYDVLLQRAIERLPQNDNQAIIDSLYQQWIKFRKTDAAHPRALLMVTLDYLSFYQRAKNTDADNIYYIHSLDSLQREYAATDFVVEVLHRQAEYYQGVAGQARNDGTIGTTGSAAAATTVGANLAVAHKICVDGIAKYPDYERIGLLKNLLADLTNPQAGIAADNVIYPGHNLNLKVNYRNISQLTVEIYKIAAPVSIYSQWERNGQYQKTGQLVENKTFDLINKQPYLQSDTTLHIPMRDLGNYEYVVFDTQNKEALANQQFSVSRLATVTRAVGKNWEILVTDRLSGEPVKGARVNFYKNENRTLNVQDKLSVTTDKLGLASRENVKNVSYYNVTFGDDVALITSSLPWVSSSAGNPNATNVQLQLFTDRGIYRPRQIVQFKGIAFESGAKIQQVVPNKTYTLTLRDNNSKMVAEQRVTTNDYGSFAGEFELPDGGTTGHYNIQANVDGGWAGFQVEEYKRPTFDIRFDKIDKTYTFGDKITATGTAQTFSGINLQQANVAYKVTRQSHWLFRRYMAPQQVASGIAHTNSDGKFEITFAAEKAPNDLRNPNVFYTYNIETTVTDTNGETQSSTTHFSIGDKSMLLTINGLKEVVNKDKLPKITIDALNLSNQPIAVKGSFEILAGDKKVASGAFEAGKEILPQLKNLPSGAYKLTAKANDTQGREVTVEQDFTLASESDKKPPVFATQWMLTPDEIVCKVGEKATIRYGSSEKKVYVLYELFADNKKLSAQRFMLNNEIRTLEIPYLESYGDGISAVFSFIKNEQFYTKTVRILKKQPDKKLAITTAVFRDKLLPGGKEEWRVSIKDADGKPISAEVLAGMYDASLDKIYKYSWNFNPIRPINIWSPYMQQSNDLGKSHTDFSGKQKHWKIPSFSIPALNTFGYSPYRQMISSYGKGLKSARAGSDITNKKGVVAEDATAAPATALLMDASETAAFDDAQPTNIRENFQETAFFYPQLKTNATGEAIISFTVPESNTAWKFQTVAHTKDLHYGSLMREVVTQKKLMVTPNVPRFLRQKDAVTFTSNISNLSDEPISGAVTLDMEASTALNKRQNLIPQKERSKSFTLEAGKTVAVSWTFEIYPGVEALTAKIVAKSDNYSDGEQHNIPVLPNRMLVTETLPLTVVEAGTQTFTFEALKDDGTWLLSSPTLDSYRLTLEFADNPLEYAVQAYPKLIAPQKDDVISWFAAYYAASVATKLDVSADVNKANYVRSQALEKLRELQAEDGGWEWFKGMSSNVSITQWVLYGMAQLDGGLRVKPAMTDNVADVEAMTHRAVRFIDKKFAEHFADLKKHNKNWEKTQSISTYELEYLLVRGLYKDIPLGDNQAAVDFYTNLAEKYWANNPNLYDRAIAAMVLVGANQKLPAQAIIKSLREHATEKPDLGMYWANNTMNCFMTQSAVSVHTFIMDAFQKTGAANKETDAMKLWLLQQKRTQEWESVPATVNAIQALLTTGSNWVKGEGSKVEGEGFKVEGGSATITVNKQVVETSQSKEKTGYIRKSWNEPKIFSDKVTVTKTGNAPAWGAVYWQYYEDLNKIKTTKTAKSGLSVTKTLIPSTLHPKPITPSPTTPSTLQVGDKVTIRLTVKSDRDMEYVQLTDMRAACMEPVNQLSGTQWKPGIVYYQAPKDESTTFFIQALPKGTYHFDYDVWITRAGDYSSGICTVECLYAPAFAGHSEGGRVRVK
ncbi:hypothetical protein AGMMS49982_17120 [Bacteroidia bacterium]|nr:hypothetical protein AGMMS49982_17120 [Bacteroidia bacterium]